MARILGFNFGGSTKIEEPEYNPFALSLEYQEFVTITNYSFWRKIVSRTFNRTNFSDPENKITLVMQDSFDKSEQNNSIIHLLATALSTQSTQLALKYDAAANVAIALTPQEIDAYKKATVKPKNQLIMNFSSFNQSKISKMFFWLLYLVNQIRSTQWGMAGSLILRIDKAREKLSNGRDISSEVSNIVNAIKDGRSAALDANDKIGGVDSIHSEVIKDASDAIYSDMAAMLDMPLSLVSMTTTTGMSVTGDADANQESDALESYFWSLMFPLFVKLFGITPTYRKEKWRAFESKARTTMMIENINLLTQEAKQKMVADIFELDITDTQAETINEPQI